MHILTRIPRLAPALGLALVLAASCAWATTQPVRSHDHRATSTTLDLSPDGHKWASDASLSHAMQRIRDVLQPDAETILADRLDKRQYRRFAKSINGVIADMVANCSLPVEADARFHIILAQMMDGVAAMEGQDEIGTRREGAVMILAAIEKYAMYFDAPGFEPVRR